MGNAPAERSFTARWRSAALGSARTSSEKLVLVALGEHANPHGTDCFPGIAAIARMTGLSERTCRRALDGLDGAWFTRKERRSGGQAWRSYTYRLLIPEGEVTITSRQGEGAVTVTSRWEEVAVTVSPPPDETCGHKDLTSGERCGHSGQKVRSPATEGAVTVTDDLIHYLDHDLDTAHRLRHGRFEAFWKVYPLKKGRANAARSWKRQRLDSIADRIIADVQARLAGDRQWLDGYIPHGSTYINGRGWEDAITPPHSRPSRRAGYSPEDYAI